MAHNSHAIHRHYIHGGMIRYQNSYKRKDGTNVQAHFKTWPDNKVNNNRKSILGY